MIVKRKGKWCVLSETTGRSFGCYDSEDAAKRRLRQVEYFKHLGKQGIKRRGKK